MANGNGEGDKKKWCPLLNEWCTQEVLDRCAFQATMTKRMGALMQEHKICGFGALLTMVSELNSKTVRAEKPGQKIILP